MLLSPARLKEVLKVSGRLAGNPGPSSGPLGPAKPGAWNLDDESYPGKWRSGRACTDRSQGGRGEGDGD